MGCSPSALLEQIHKGSSASLDKVEKCANKKTSPPDSNSLSTSSSTTTATTTLQINSFAKGDKYYLSCVVSRNFQGPENLTVSELLPELIFNNLKIKILILEDTGFNGHIDKDYSNAEFPNLTNALGKFLDGNKVGILTANGISVALCCKSEINDNCREVTKFWLFDPQSRGPKGCKAQSKGSACCMRFTCINSLQTHLRRNLFIKGDRSSHILNVFSITPITVSSDVAIKLPSVLNTSKEPCNDNRSYGTRDPAVTGYVEMCGNTLVLRGSFHQGSETFSELSRGRQCTANATVACVASYFEGPNSWKRNTIDIILTAGDDYYQNCIKKRRLPDFRERNVEFLSVTELIPNLKFKNIEAEIDILHEHVFNGHVDHDNSGDGFPNLTNALKTFFEQHSYGILTVNSTAVALIKSNTLINNINSQKFWLFDSHSRDINGLVCSSGGTAVCLGFNSIDGLFKIVKHNLYVKELNESLTSNIYCLTPINIMSNNFVLEPEPINFEQCRIDINPSVDNNHDQQNLEDNSDCSIIFRTSMLHAIDENIPNLDSIVSVGSNDDNAATIMNVRRKTMPPLNIERERRMEELGWYYLYPDGKNGFGEPREIPITPLEYFQARVMSNDRRFYRNDFLFFALSVVEYFRAKSSISVSCRMRQGGRTPTGLIDNMHITMRNIRGSSAYWHRSCAELVAMVRSLGPPTWFVTFSCNDLNWLDMRKALLIADGRNPEDAETLNFSDRLKLVENYPIVVSRQFMLRVNALIRFLKKNPSCLGGLVVDFWYRIEFQNRGSPHLHMLIWCENVPDFMTREGLAVIEEVVSCSLNPDDADLSKLVKEVQIHKHTNTCYKDRNNQNCRFGFPRAINDITKCLGPDETLANNGRFTVLKRSADEVMVNNYNPTLLHLWEANMDIQPCGNVEAVAYYIAKYASKCEPNDPGDVTREAIENAKKRGGSLWSKLFSISMVILSRRLVSAPECAYRLCHLPLKMSSRKTVFINSCKPQERFRILRLEGDENSLFNNIFDRYVERPDNLEHLSLAEFAVRYEAVSRTVWTEDDGDAELAVNLDDNQPRFIKLKDNTRMKIRTKAAVLRTRYYTLNSDKEGYYYSLIVCHIPFRNEHDLLLENESAEACFLRRQHNLRPLLGNLTTEQFAHAEQMIQAALAQAVALNAVHNLQTASIQNQPELYADEQIVQNDNDYEDVFEEIAPMAETDFLNGIQSLNVQQKNLLKEVSRAIEKDLNNEENQLLMFITGGAGSGKSYILKLAVEHIKRCYTPTVDLIQSPIFVEVGALTGVAARQIFGKTLHSLFVLPIEKGKTMTYRKMTGQRLENERIKWRYINWLIIDEVSMVSYENLRIIHLRLQEFKNNEKLFGGINILLFGDIMQLPPVKGHWCFIQPPWCSAEVNLWHKFSFCELTINMRQRGDTEFIDILNKLRFGELTVAQLEVLIERRYVSLTGEFADGEAVRIFPTVKLVEQYNAKMTETISQTKRVYDINCVDKSREAATYDRKPPNNVIPHDVNNCGGLLHSIKLAQSSRVMLRRNILVSDGLVNGVMGIVKSFKWPALRRDQLETKELPEAVLIKFDDESVGTRAKDENGLVSIVPVSATFQASKGYGNVERRMLPLILSWGVTVHKLQGTTLERAVIDLGKKVFAKGQVYVALSRVKSLNGLAIADLDTNKLLNKPHDEKALTEMYRLRNI